MLHKENCFIAEIEGIFDRKILEEANNISFVCTSLAIGSDRQLGKVLLETYIFLNFFIILFIHYIILILFYQDFLSLYFLLYNKNIFLDIKF